MKWSFNVYTVSGLSLLSVLKLLKMAVGMRALLDTVIQALPQVLHQLLSVSFIKFCSTLIHCILSGERVYPGPRLPFFWGPSALHRPHLHSQSAMKRPQQFRLALMGCLENSRNDRSQRRKSPACTFFYSIRLHHRLQGFSFGNMLHHRTHY